MLLGWTQTKLWTLKYGLKSIQTSLILRKRPPKPYKLLKIFYQFCDNCKIPSCTYYLKEADIKPQCLPILKSVTENMKNFKSLYSFGDAVSKLQTFEWTLNDISRSITWSLYTLKALYLVKWPISTWSFMWWCQFIDWLKFEARPSSLPNFGMAYSPVLAGKNSIDPWYRIKFTTGTIPQSKFTNTCFKFNFIYMTINHCIKPFMAGPKGILSFASLRPSMRSMRLQHAFTPFWQKNWNSQDAFRTFFTK